MNKANDDGYTPLYIASLNGHLSTVEPLINHGADLNQGRKNGWTPI